MPTTTTHIAHTMETGHGQEHGHWFRRSSVSGQTQSPNGNDVKRDTSTGRFMDQKNGGEPFKGGEH